MAEAMTVSRPRSSTSAKGSVKRKMKVKSLANCTYGKGMGVSAMTAQSLQVALSALTWPMHSRSMFTCGKCFSLNSGKMAPSRLRAAWYTKWFPQVRCPSTSEGLKSAGLLIRAMSVHLLVWSVSSMRCLPPEVIPWAWAPPAPPVKGFEASSLLAADFPESIPLRSTWSFRSRIMSTAQSTLNCTSIRRNSSRHSRRRTSFSPSFHPPLPSEQYMQILRVSSSEWFSIAESFETPSVKRLWAIVLRKTRRKPTRKPKILWASSGRGFSVSGFASL
mmetsp:Transcript_28634/g.63942  ORF Transcript_28634/g.63942 Transcript_28634/m.63942 type:complete len:276 (-) Transcript_28634:330-1157(-)